MGNHDENPFQRVTSVLFSKWWFYSFDFSWRLPKNIKDSQLFLGFHFEGCGRTWRNLVRRCQNGWSNNYSSWNSQQPWPCRSSKEYSGETLTTAIKIFSFLTDLLDKMKHKTQLLNDSYWNFVDTFQLAHEKLRHIGEQTLSVLDDSHWKEIISEDTNRLKF